MAEVDDAAVAARTKELLADDEAIKTQYGDGTLMVKTLRKAVAAALGVEESAIKKVVKATLLSYMDEQDAPEEEAVVEDDPADEDEEPKAKKAKKEKKPKAKRTDRLTDKDALNARMKEDNWTVTEKMRPAKDGVAPKKAGDKYFRKPGEAKQYRSLLEIARAHYPEFLTGEPPAKKLKPPSERKERAPRVSAAAAKPEKKLVVGKITKAGKGAASSAPPKKKKAEALPSPHPPKKPRPKKPEDTVNSAWASVEERVAAADQVLPKMVEGGQWPEIVKMLKMLGRMDVDVDALTSCGIGRTVSKLRKVPDDDVKKIAKALVTKWKDLVAEQEPIAAEAPAASEPEAPAAAEEAPAAEAAADEVAAEVLAEAAGEVAAGEVATEAAAAGASAAVAAEVAAEATAEVAAEVAAEAAAAPADDAGTAPMDVDASAAAPEPAPADGSA